MKPRKLDPRAQQAIDIQRAHPSQWTGPILLRYLAAVMPKIGMRRCWLDAVVIFLFCKLAGVHRVKAGCAPFWRGAMYEVERNDLAEEFDCDPDEISTALSWLEELGLIHRQRSTRIDGCGKPCGTDVFVAPRMDRIKMLLDYFEDNGRGMTASQIMDSDPLQVSFKSPSATAEIALTKAPSPVQGCTYLNCAKPQQKHDAESGVGASAQRQEHSVKADRGSSDANGGGEAAAQVKSTQVLSTKSSLQSKPASPIKGTDGNSNLPVWPQTRWEEPQPPKDLDMVDDDARSSWAEAARFGDLWAQVTYIWEPIACMT